jgi:hypothetical protein
MLIARDEALGKNTGSAVFNPGAEPVPPVSRLP